MTKIGTFWDVQASQESESAAGRLRDAAAASEALQAQLHDLQAQQEANSGTPQAEQAPALISAEDADCELSLQAADHHLMILHAASSTLLPATCACVVGCLWHKSAIFVCLLKVLLFVLDSWLLTGVMLMIV